MTDKLQDCIHMLQRISDEDYHQDICPLNINGCGCLLSHRLQNHIHLHDNITDNEINFLDSGSCKIDLYASAMGIPLGSYGTKTRQDAIGRIKIIQDRRRYI